MKIIAFNPSVQRGIKSLPLAEPLQKGLPKEAASDSVSFSSRPTLRFAGKGGMGSKYDNGSSEGSDSETDVVDEVKHLSEQIRIQRNRNLAKELKGITFRYGQNTMSALTILEVVYQRDAEERGKSLTSDYFSQLNGGSDEAQFFATHQKLLDKKLIEEVPAKKNESADYIRTKTQERFIGRITNLGQAVVEQHKRDAAMPSDEEAETVPQAPPLQRVTDAKVLKLKLLLGLSEWGQPGVAILKALDAQTAARPWYQKLVKLPVLDAVLKAALKLSDSKSDAPLQALVEFGLVARGKNPSRYQLTDSGKQVVQAFSEKNGEMLENSLFKPEDMRNLLKARIIDIKIAQRELEQMLEQFETGFQKASSDVTDIEKNLEKLEKEALSIFAESKAPDLDADKREKKELAALKRKKESLKLRKLLVEEKQPALQQATCQLDAARQIEAKISQNLTAQLQQAQKDEVFLQAAILQNNLREFVDRWSLDGSSLQNPMGQLREELAAKWAEQSMETDAADVAIKNRIQQRLELRQEADLRAQLERELQAQQGETPPAQDATDTPPEASDTPAKTLKASKKADA